MAKGDYQQRVDFMGDFSEAFNRMTEQLEQQRSALLAEIENRQREILRMAQNKSLFEMLAGQLDQWIIVADADTAEWLFVSREIDGALADPSCEQQLRGWLTRQAEAVGDKAEILNTELELNAKTGAHYYSVSVHPLHWRQHRAVAFVLTDISLERERLNRLQSICNIDTLTQAYNRRYGMEVLNEWLSQDKSFILCFADIDNLKLVNDQFGHPQGDRYLLLVTDILREFSPDATVCRMGGDEFMLLAQDWTPKAAEERLETLRRQLAFHNDGTNISYDHSISYGVIPVGTDNALTAGDLLYAADEKMYEYKRAYKLRRKNQC